MQRCLMGIILIMSLLTLTVTAESTPATGVYDNFDNAELSLWQGPGKTTIKLKDQTVVFRQTARFKRMPLLSKQAFDLDLASQQYPIDLTVELVDLKGNNGNKKEHNNFEMGWANEKGKTIFALRWEFLSEGFNQANRMFNSKTWGARWWAKPPKVFFDEGDILGLRVTDTQVQILRNGKVTRSTARPADLPNIDKCRIYLSFMGAKNGALLTLDNVLTQGVK
ncbi:MAG: hypothetical protein JKX85_16135 [Phycisphaeraceae bacterium]|nr:hypothetical protein [Phycisphaeraceae bacterium]